MIHTDLTMKSNVINWFFLGLLYSFYPQKTLQGTPATSPYYIGAVVEYHPIRSGKSAVTVSTANANNYLTFIKKAKSINSNLDIIVFPETGVTTSGDGNDLLDELMRTHVAPAASYIPIPSEKVIPCGNEDINVTETIRVLSCAAIQYQTYIVVNHLEKEDCKNCSRDHINLYNSNIVFDRSGTIIARYRKYNLFGELGTNVTSEPELSTFETDFGVKFGQFICFDILFETPALELLRKFKVTDIVYSTHWFSQMPFLDELEIQAAWSYANDVNFLASGFNTPSTGSTGSGIYAGKSKILGTFRTETDKNGILISKIPKVINGERKIFVNETILYEFTEYEIPTTEDHISEEYIFETEDLTEYTTKLIGPDVRQHLVLSNNNHSCYFTFKTNYNKTVKKSGEKYYRYRFAVFSGPKSNGLVGGEAQICGMIACTNESLSSCGKRFHGDHTVKDWISFEQLRISTMVLTKKNIRILNLPVTLQTNLRPLNPMDYYFKSCPNYWGSYKFVSLHLKNINVKLMSFGIYGIRYTSNDTI